MEFRVDPAHTPRGNVLVVHGEFDVATAPVFSDAVAQELEAGTDRLVIDLTPTTFADSTAFRAVARAAEASTAAGATMQVVCPSTNRHVRRVLDILDMAALVPVTETVADTGVDSPPSVG